jgi:hypothetical protein
MSLSSLRPACCRGLPVIALLAAATFVHAQSQSQAQAQAPAPGTATRTARADPLDAQARVPAAVHSSALSHYRRLGDDARIGWKEANETVNRIGGWRAYAREAQQPEPAASAPASRPSPAPVPASAPAPAPASGAKPAHGGHRMH